MEVKLFQWNGPQLQEKLNLCTAPFPFFDLDVATFFAGLIQLLIDYVNNHQ